MNEKNFSLWSVDIHQEGLKESIKLTSSEQGRADKLCRNLSRQVNTIRDFCRTYLNVKNGSVSSSLRSGILTPALMAAVLGGCKTEDKVKPKEGSPESFVEQHDSLRILKQAYTDSIILYTSKSELSESESDKVSIWVDRVNELEQNLADIENTAYAKGINLSDHGIETNADVMDSEGAPTEEDLESETLQDTTQQKLQGF